MSTQTNARHILLTGSPGVGKTTLIRKVYEELKKLNPKFAISGFYTSEVRCLKTRNRTGFELITVPENEKASLATVNAEETSTSRRNPHLGKYVVTLDSFEPVVLKCLKNSLQSKLVIVDEIGKMECYSKSFCNEIVELFKRGDCCIFGTIPLEKSGGVSRLPTVETITKRDDVKIVFVTRENRDKLFEELKNTLQTMLE